MRIEPLLSTIKYCKQQFIAKLHTTIGIILLYAYFLSCGWSSVKSLGFQRVTL